MTIRKYFVRYIIFWIPAILAAYLTGSGYTAAYLAQWFLGFFMLLGWGVNTGMFAYSSPRGALGFILAYLGLSVLLITWLFRTPFGSTFYRVLDTAAGAFTFRPLYMLYGVLRDFNVFGELWVAGIVAGACAVGFLCGVFYRQVRPNPYRPTFMGDD